ncbi:MAG: ABC-2 family transporter protein [Chloroflexota bacterium]|nr:ABC-2 family transporter protein [Chloroflexota bacterium]
MAGWLPFRFMAGFPAEVLLGHLPSRALVAGFACQLGWLGLASLAAAGLWRRGLRRYTALGG